MGMAKVNLKEVDLSTRVASFGGVYGAMVIPAKRGPVAPFLCTSDTQFLKKYTAQSKIKVGEDLAMYSALSFLERGDKLWVKRASLDALFAGVLHVSSASTDANASLTGTVSDASARAFVGDEVLFIYASSVGAWANDYKVKVTNSASDALLVEENSFRIEVFHKDNLVVPVETHIVSRTMGQKNGRGQNMFVEDVLDGSEFIRAISNPAVEGAVMPKTDLAPIALASGSDGLAVTDAVMVSSADAFKNPNEYPVTIFMDGGYATPTYGRALDTIAQNRQDSVAILTVPYSAEASSDYLNEIIDYRKNQLNINSSFSALYTPHLQIQDKFNDRKIWVSPDGGVGGSICFSSQAYEIWYPPAGFKRGILNVLDTKVRFSDGEMDTLQNNQINPIRFMSGKGIIIWGQKTLQARESALSGLNVRLLLCVIEPAIKDFLGDFLFDLNDEGNRSIAEIKISKYLEGIQAKKGLYGFSVIANDTNNLDTDVDAGRMNVDIYIKPTISTEEVAVRVVITPNSVSFEQAQNAV